MFCLQGQQHRGGEEDFLDSHLLLKCVMVDQLTLVWKKASQLPELRYFLKSWSCLTCSVGWHERRNDWTDLCFSALLCSYENR